MKGITKLKNGINVAVYSLTNSIQIYTIDKEENIVEELLCMSHKDLDGRDPLGLAQSHWAVNRDRLKTILDSNRPTEKLTKISRGKVVAKLKFAEIDGLNMVGIRGTIILEDNGVKSDFYFPDKSIFDYDEEYLIVKRNKL